MTKQLANTTTLTLLALVLSTAPPANAASGSLLSGYGGPGQGSQAILGSALLNGPSGGSTGSGSTGSGSSSASSSRAGTGSAATGKRRPSASGASRRASRRAHSGAAATSHGTRSSSGAARTYTASDEAATSQARAQGSSTLGLSGTDFLYLLLALAALALTAVLTRLLARPGRDGNVHG
jgi:hypothetical protein